MTEGTPTPLTFCPIERAVVLVRGQRALLDADLAAFFGVPTKRLNELVRRSAARFPEDFAFRLTAEEAPALGRPRRAVPPRAFTALGVLMLAGLLRCALAVEASVFVVRAVVLLANAPRSPRGVWAGLLELERSIGPRDHPVRRLLSAVRLMALPGGRVGRVVGLRGEARR